MQLPVLGTVHSLGELQVQQNPYKGRSPLNQQLLSLTQFITISNES